jgi:hypothetical protein
VKTKKHPHHNCDRDGPLDTELTQNQITPVVKDEKKSLKSLKDIV